MKHKIEADQYSGQLLFCNVMQYSMDFFFSSRYNMTRLRSNLRHAVLIEHKVKYDQITK
ncbi:MAG: hypothetical protein PHE02_02205 [Lachnospiraceae bacterium]|nr:hypothetical protein [Lachnospiraceae bacterium]